MATEPLKCAVCEVELTTIAADDLVPTDAGPVHRECFEGPVPPPAKANDLLSESEVWTPEMIAEEEEARRDHGDVPLSWGDYPEAMLRALPEHFDCGMALERAEAMMGDFLVEPKMSAEEYARCEGFT